jgi:hypothetical protein
MISAPISGEPATSYTKTYKGEAMTKQEKARLAAKKLWVLGCKHDGIDPETTFVSWSKDNPYSKPYDKAMEAYQAIAWGNTKQVII